MAYDWIIGICDTSDDGIIFKAFRGTEELAKMFLYSLIEEERKEKLDGIDLEDWESYLEFGCTESVDEIESDSNGYFYGYNGYSDHHTDFSMKRLDLVWR